MPKVIELTRPSYDEVRAAIGGGFLQMVPDFWAHKGLPCEVYCDEEGLLKRMEHNAEASKLWQEFLESKYPGQWSEDMAQLVGVVCIAMGGMRK